MAGVSRALAYAMPYRKSPWLCGC